MFRFKDNEAEFFAEQSLVTTVAATTVAAVAGVFAETVSSSATGATGGSVWPLFHPFSIFLFLSFSLCRFSIRHFLPIPRLRTRSHRWHLLGGMI